MIAIDSAQYMISKVRQAVSIIVQGLPDHLRIFYS